MPEVGGEDLFELVNDQDARQDFAGRGSRVVVLVVVVAVSVLGQVIQEIRQGHVRQVGAVVTALIQAEQEIVDKNVVDLDPRLGLAADPTHGQYLEPFLFQVGYQGGMDQ